MATWDRSDQGRTISMANESANVNRVPAVLPCAALFSLARSWRCVPTEPRHDRFASGEPSRSWMTGTPATANHFTERSRR
jgi:hypothetical protein